MYLQTLIEEQLDSEVTHEPTDEGDTLLCMLFRLEFSRVGNRLSINWLQVMEEGAGIARAVLEAVHRYCAEFGLIPSARRVFPDKEPFWEHFGYVPDPDHPDYYVQVEFV